MKAIAKTSPGQGAALIDLREPSPGPREVVFAMQAAAICGSDLTIYRWHGWATGLGEFLPFVLGHEVCGSVVAVGEQVENVKPGDRIAIETHIPCGHCWYCTHDRAHVCSNMVLYGHQINGGFSEFGCVACSAVWKLAPDIPSRLGALMEPLGVAIHSLDAVPIEDQPVAIIGAGPIGLLVAAAASVRNPKTLIVIEPEKSRRDLALAVGATHVIDPNREKPGDIVRNLTEGVGVEVVIDCSGHVPAILESINFTRVCGYLVMVGNPHVPLSINAFQDVIHKELHIHGIWGRRLWSTWEETEAFIRHYPEKLNKIITASYPLAEGCAALEKALGGQDGKVMLVP